MSTLVVNLLSNLNGSDIEIRELNIEASDSDSPGVDFPLMFGAV
jgi:hypothetical protein